LAPGAWVAAGSNGKAFDGELTAIFRQNFQGHAKGADARVEQERQIS